MSLHAPYPPQETRYVTQEEFDAAMRENSDGFYHHLLEQSDPLIATVEQPEAVGQMRERIVKWSARAPIVDVEMSGS